MAQKITEYVPIPDEEINILWEEIKQEHTKNLKEKGVNLPKEKTASMYWLVYLWKYKGCYVDKKVITKFVKDHIDNASDDQQVRHLAQQIGYNMVCYRDYHENEPVPKGFYLLKDLDNTSPNWHKQRRQEILDVDDWEELKKAFNYCCATCGTREGAAHRVTGKKVTLQKGHMDPMKPLEMGNIIPQCNYCNGEYYKDDFAFNAFGFPHNIHNPNYILKSPEDIQLQMRDILNLKYKTSKDNTDNSKD